MSFNRFGQISLGITGLFTLGVVIWRGILHAHEEKLQAAQLRETENNNIAKLLVGGTKLLGKDTTEAENMAGIACLANIIEGQSKFDKQAVEILQRFIVSFDDKALHGEGSTRISEITDYKLFLGDAPAFDNIFAALCALERYGELKQEFVHLNCSIAIKGKHPSAHYKWLNTITWYKTNFNQVELIDKAKYIECHFVDCILSEDAIFAHGNIFDEVFFNMFAIDSEGDDSFWFSNCFDEKFLNTYTANQFGMINSYNDKKITKKYKRAFLEHFKVEASDLETFEKERSYLV